jgi:LPXTG-motif cell wall-anchored protein
VLAALGLVLLGAGLMRERVACTRAADGGGACTITSGLPLAEETADIPLAAIAEHRFEVSDSRAGRRGATVLVDRAGRRLIVAVDAEAAARARHDALHAFFIGETTGIEVTTGPSWWLAVLGLLALAASGVWLARARRRHERDPAPASERPRGAHAPVLGLVVGGLVLAGMAASTLYSRTRGSLQLICHQRCEVGGGTCMPGGDVVLTLTPGEHEVRIYDPDAPATPIVRRVLVTRGQVTRFECAL